MSLLEATGVRAGYGDTEIIHGVDMRVDAGEVVTIIGPNGSGKSTMMKAIVGIVQASSGEMRFDGRRIDGLGADRRIPLGLCYVPQTDNVFPTLTITENLEMGGFLRSDRLDGRIREMFELFPDLAEKRNARAGSLSGGQRQMMAVARALRVCPISMYASTGSAT